LTAASCVYPALVTNHEEPRVVAIVGGPADESSATLALYGDELDPDAVTTLLGCAPTRAHRKGDRRREKSVPATTGAWLLRVESRAPDGPGELIERLLSRFPPDPAFWIAVTAQYTLQIRIGVHTKGNFGFHVSPPVLAAIATTGAELAFDVYLYPDEDE
jgi:hypothetical protein